MEPVSRSVPVPSFVSVPAPLMLPLKVKRKFCESMLPFAVRTIGILKFRLFACVCRVDPAPEIVRVFVPSALLFPIERVPKLKFVPPV